MPSQAAAGSAAKVADLVKAQTAASKKEKGNLRFEGLQRIIRTNHFVILEAWSTPEARAAHASAAHTVAKLESAIVVETLKWHATTFTMALRIATIEAQL